MPRPITIRVAGPAEAEIVWRLTVEAYLPDRERLHPPSGVFRETVADVQRAMDEGTVYVARRGARTSSAPYGCSLPATRMPCTVDAWRCCPLRAAGASARR